MAEHPTKRPRGVPIPALRNTRMARLLTQEELAAKAGVSIGAVKSAEGGGNAQVRIIRKLAAALDVEPEALTKQPE